MRAFASRLLPLVGLACLAPFASAGRDPFEGSWHVLFTDIHPNERVVVNFRHGVMRLEALVQINDRILGAIIAGPYRRTDTFMQVKLTGMKVDAALVTPEEKSRILRTPEWKEAKARLDRLSTLGQSFVFQSKDRIYFHSRDPKNRLWLTRAR